MEGLRRLLAALAGAAAIFALGVWLAGGVEFLAAGLRVRSHHPVRPLVAAAILAAAYLSLSRHGGLQRDLTWFARAVSAPRAAVAIAVAATVVALASNARVAGASDSFGYVMHAEAWLAGTLKAPPEPLAAVAPWPRALDTFTPFWHHPAPDRQSIVPVMSPGLPLLMALVKAALGHCAMFWVVPLTGALLIWTTFVIGRHVASDGVGVGAAWLVATSPTILSMTKSTMSDVPATAFWALSAACLLRPGVSSALCSGLAASMAIFTRPNLLAVGIWMGIWLIWREWRAERRLATVVAFAAGAAPGCVAVAAINYSLRGSAVASGYGDLDAIFSWAYIPINARQFFGWVLETQTPLWVAGFVALALPLPALWPAADHRRRVCLLFGVVIAVWASYLAYMPFGAWWFLRFVLPSWPALAVGTAGVVLAATRVAGRWRRVVAGVALAALGVYGVMVAIRLGVYPPGEGERRYATIAEVVARHTEPSAVIIAQDLSGPILYYSGRVPLRYDELDPQWLDRTVAWLEAQGRRPYVLLDETEVSGFRQRFAGQLAGREMAPMLAYRAHLTPGVAYLFDPLRPHSQTTVVPPIRHTDACPPPGPRR